MTMQSRIATMWALGALVTFAACDKKSPESATPTEHANHATASAKSPAAGAQTVSVTVTEDGFEPSRLEVQKHKPVTLVVTRKTDQTCAKELVIKEHNIKVALPLNEPVKITFTPHESGELKYACGMDMISGVIVVN